MVTSKALSEDWQNRRYESEKLWAYRPIKVDEVPEGKHPVDWFINQKLEELGLEKAPIANARELYRRLSFGLTGLPPSPSEVENFEKEFKQSKQALSLHAKKLMASPHYESILRGTGWMSPATLIPADSPTITPVRMRGVTGTMSCGHSMRTSHTTNLSWNK